MYVMRNDVIDDAEYFMCPAAAAAARRRRQPRRRQRSGRPPPAARSDFLRDKLLFFTNPVLIGSAIFPSAL